MTNGNRTCHLAYLLYVELLGSAGQRQSIPEEEPMVLTVACCFDTLLPHTCVQSETAPFFVVFHRGDGDDGRCCSCCCFFMTPCICKTGSTQMFDFSGGRHSFYEISHVKHILWYSDAPFASCAREDPVRLSNAHQQSACTHARELHATV